MSDSDFDSDRQTLRALRAAVTPPAPSPPADPAGRPTPGGLMSADLTRPDTDEGSRATGTHGRSPLTWLVAAAAVAADRRRGRVRCQRPGQRQPRAAGGQHRPVHGPDARRPDHGLGVAAAGQVHGPERPRPARVPPSPSTGTVTAIAGDTVTLDTTRGTPGDAADVVEVTAPPEHAATLIGATHFQVGGATSSRPTTARCRCGFSGPYDDDLGRRSTQRRSSS